jgi:hypothetical protein
MQDSKFTGVPYIDICSLKFTHRDDHNPSRSSNDLCKIFSVFFCLRISKMDASFPGIEAMPDGFRSKDKSDDCVEIILAMTQDKKTSLFHWVDNRLETNACSHAL